MTKILNYINTEKLNKLCKILVLSALTPFVIKTSGNFLWNETTSFYINFYGKYYNTLNAVVLIFSCILIVLSYLFETLLLYKLLSTGKMVVRNYKIIILKLILTFSLFFLGEYCSIKFGNFHVFKYLIFAPLMWIFSSDEIVDYLLIVMPLKLAIALLLSGTNMFVDLQNIDHPHALGLSHANAVGYVLFFEMLFFYYKYGNNRENVFGIIAAFVMVINAFITNCRGAIVLSVLFIIAIYLRKLFIYCKNKHPNIYEKSTKVFIHVFKVLPVITFILFLLLGLLTYYKVVPNVFSGRFSIVISFLINEGIELIGQPNILVDKYILDGIYGLVLCRFGVIVFILMIIYMMYVNARVANTKTYKLMFIFAFYFIYSLIENSPFTLSISILYWATLFIDMKEMEFIQNNDNLGITNNN